MATLDLNDSHDRKADRRERPSIGVLTRRRPNGMTEWPGEVGLIVELHFDRQQRRGVSVQETVARLLDASADEVSMRWDAEGMGEATDEVRW